jgi:dephospho-CoA kinase
MRIIGLTGGLGSGKSTVAEVLRELGAAVVDADEAAREVVRRGQPGFDQVVEAFGAEMVAPGGELDRNRLADLVFADDAARTRLNAIVHPLVRDWMAARTAEAAESGADLVVLDLPLLYESGLERGMEEVVVVYAPEEAQVERAVARGMREADARARVASQMPLAEKRARATRVIDNSGTPAATRAAVELLWRELTGGGPVRDEGA